jgi:hypothetical protein
MTPHNMILGTASTRLRTIPLRQSKRLHSNSAIARAAALHAVGPLVLGCPSPTVCLGCQAVRTTTLGRLVLFSFRNLQVRVFVLSLATNQNLQVRVFVLVNFLHVVFFLDGIVCSGSG